MKPIDRHIYANAEFFKYEKARVAVVSLKSGEYAIDFKVLSEDTNPRAIHSVERGKIVKTSIKFSKEAALSIMVGLQERLAKDGVLP